MELTGPAVLGPLSGLAIALGVLTAMFKLYQSEVANARVERVSFREERELAAKRDEEHWKVVADLATATRESNLLARQSWEFYREVRERGRE